MIHRLDDKNIYVGNQEVVKGYLGTNLLYNSADLVFPEPPTTFGTRSLKWAYFFGSGEIINYYGSGVIEELNAGVIKENGLYLEEMINFHDFSGDGGSIVLDMTLEKPNDIIDSLQPGKAAPLMEAYLYYGTQSVVFVGKASDGTVRLGIKHVASNSSITIYASDINAASNIGEAEYIHITYSNWGSAKGPYYSFGNDININGVNVLSQIDQTRSGRQSFQYAKISKGILLYDLKIYSGKVTGGSYDSLAATNYNGIKDLPFVRTNQL